jgi:hypothetical protein
MKPETLDTASLLVLDVWFQSMTLRPLATLTAPAAAALTAVSASTLDAALHEPIRDATVFRVRDSADAYAPYHQLGDEAM